MSRNGEQHNHPGEKLTVSFINLSRDKTLSGLVVSRSNEFTVNSAALSAPLSGEYAKDAKSPRCPRKPIRHPRTRTGAATTAGGQLIFKSRRVAHFPPPLPGPSKERNQFNFLSHKNVARNSTVWSASYAFIIDFPNHKYHENAGTEYFQQFPDSRAFKIIFNIEYGSRRRHWSHNSNYQCRRRYDRVRWGEEAERGRFFNTINYLI